MHGGVPRCLIATTLALAACGGGDDAGITFDVVVTEDQIDVTIDAAVVGHVDFVPTSDGGIVAASGALRDAADREVVPILWKLDASGQLDTEFGTGGVVFWPGGLNGPGRLREETDGSLLLATLRLDVLTLTRFAPTGALVDEIDVHLPVEVTGQVVILEQWEFAPDGSFVILARTDSDVFHALRVARDGTVVHTTPEETALDWTWNSVVFDSEGRPLVFGSLGGNGMIARLTSELALDETFAPIQEPTSASLRDPILLADGGFAAISIWFDAIVFDADLTTRGDVAFEQQMFVGELLALPDGGFLMRNDPSYRQDPPYVARVHADGTLDPDFGVYTAGGPIGMIQRVDGSSFAIGSAGSTRYDPEVGADINVAPSHVYFTRLPVTSP